MYPTQSTPSLVQLAEKLDETQVSPGILGFIVFALLGGAVWLLLKSMTRHMKRIDFEEQDAPPRARTPRPRTPADPAAQSDGAGGDGAQSDDGRSDGAEGESTAEHAGRDSVAARGSGSGSAKRRSEQTEQQAGSAEQ